MDTFSERNGYSIERTIVEDAPHWLRDLYFREVLSYFVTDDLEGDDDYDGIPDDEALRELGIIPNSVERFYKGLIDLQDTDDLKIKMRNDFNNKTYMFEIIRDCRWHEFYSIIEIIGKKIKEWTDETFSKYNQLTSENVERYLEISRGYGSIFNDLNGDNIDNFRYLPILSDDVMDFSWLRFYQSKHYTFQIYRDKVNKLFDANRVGWNLDEESTLKRITISVLDEKLQLISNELKQSFKQAYNHYQKSYRYAYALPLDPENSIKEIISTLESLGKRLYPKAQTLTGVVMEMRKADILPEKLLNVIQEFYNYSNKESGIRHGQEQETKVKLEDAEFCFHLGAALTHYIIVAHGYDDKDAFELS